jgi:hypothetical protein
MGFDETKPTTKEISEVEKKISNILGCKIYNRKLNK